MQVGTHTDTIDEMLRAMSQKDGELQSSAEAWQRYSLNREVICRQRMFMST